MSTPILWKRYQQYLCQVPSLGLTLDVSRMRFDDGFLDQMAAPMRQAFEAMDALERGDIANPDEKRMVGHYWLRAADLAPSPAIAAEIRNTVAEIKQFAKAVHDGTIRTPEGVQFTHVLSIGIGGSALGPMFVADALGNPISDPMEDPFHRQYGSRRDRPPPPRTRLSQIRETLCIVISKSGGHAGAAQRHAAGGRGIPQGGVGFPQACRGRHHARLATRSHRRRTEGWLHRFPMFDWVGGRTSVLSAVGLVPAALQGLDVRRFACRRRGLRRSYAGSTICGQTPRP